MNFFEKLKRSIRQNNSLLCIGLDPLPEKFPNKFKKLKSSIFEFNKEIINATANLVCAYKPQIAHYHAYNAEDQLLKTILYIQKHYPDIPVILDSKRGDIENTAQHYAIEAFHRYHADAVTINPYIGIDTITPFTKYHDKGVIILCRTSNEGSGLIQKLKINTQYLYEIIANHAYHDWNNNNNILLVMGATYPEEIRRVRKIIGNMIILVPGIGTQGGDIKAVLEAGLNKDKEGLIINSSRQILYASQKNFTYSANQEAKKLQGLINQYR